ncbi:hypothetical protein ACFPN2_28190 [Steroidobacter flavus]|uniref:Uncharacterized protein n=1 Tax=Steroidobacter flavus TaxID=1842136 RepID=A0ABV8SZF0_9GAMM
MSVEVPMKVRRLLDPLELAFFERILAECHRADRQVLEDQLRRINKVRRYEHPSKAQAQTILYWKGWFRVRRDFPCSFPSNRTEERLAEAVMVAAGERVRITAWILTGAIAWLTFEPRRIAIDARTPAPTYERFQLFADRPAGVDPAQGID